MSTTEPSKWSTALGASADVNTLPQTTPTGTGLASLSGLFPQITQIPLDSGGIAPERADFNALFKLLGDTTFFLMQGGVFTYSSSYAYRVGDLVMYNGGLYRCIQAHSAGTANPGNASYWSAIASAGDIPTKTSQLQNDSGFVTSASVPTKTSQLQNDSGFITSSSLPTVNNGTLTIQQDGTTVGTFTANQSGNTTVNLTSGGGGGGSGNWPPIVFRAINDYSNGSSAIDSAMRAAGYWRCGYAITTWAGYGSGGAGYTSYIAYAPAGYTVTQLDIDIAGDVGHSYGLDTTYSGSNPISTPGWGWYHCPAPTTAQRDEVQKPTAGMTSASEYALPTP